MKCLSQKNTLMTASQKEQNWGEIINLEVNLIKRKSCFMVTMTEGLITFLFCVIKKKKNNSRYLTFCFDWKRYKINNSETQVKTNKQITVMSEKWGALQYFLPLQLWSLSYWDISAVRDTHKQQRAATINRSYIQAIKNSAETDKQIKRSHLSSRQQLIHLQVWFLFFFYLYFICVHTSLWVKK